MSGYISDEELVEMRTRISELEERIAGYESRNSVPVELISVPRHIYYGLLARVDKLELQLMASIQWHLEEASEEWTEKDIRENIQSRARLK